ncbi:Vmc-like lipoprotein signal peptide domain-containing protein [uncultured Sutterella sp.]
MFVLKVVRSPLAFSATVIAVAASCTPLSA